MLVVVCSDFPSTLFRPSLDSTLRLVDRVQHGPVYGEAAMAATLFFPPDAKAMRTQVYKRVLEAYPPSERSSARALVESGILYL